MPLESMLPEPAPDGESAHVTFGFEEPDTEAESCQLAPTPIGQGRVAEEAQDELRMLTVTCCCEGVLEEEPPQPASTSKVSAVVPNQKNRRLRFTKSHRRVWE